MKHFDWIPRTTCHAIAGEYLPLPLVAAPYLRRNPIGQSHKVSTLLIFVAGLCFALSAVTHAQGLVEYAARGEVMVDDPSAPTMLLQGLLFRFEADPQNPIDPLTEDVTVEVFWPDNPSLRIMIPAGSFVAEANGFSVPNPVGSGLEVVLETPADPNDPNPQPAVEDLLPELVSADIRLDTGKYPTDPCALRLDLQFASQAPTPCFLPLNRVAQKVRLTFGDNAAEADILRFEFAGDLIADETGLVDLAVQGEASRDDAFQPTQLDVEWAVFAEPGPNSDGFNVTTEDVTAETFYPYDPYSRVVVPAGCFEPATQQNQAGFFVDDPLACGVQTVLAFPPDPNDPNGAPTFEDLAGEVASMDVRFHPEPCYFKFEAHYASQAPTPCFLPLNRAPVGFRLQIGNDSGEVGVTEILYASE